MSTLGRLKQNLGQIGTTTFRGYLAEDYDGIGQYILVALTRGSTSSALRARIAAGDFNSGATFPRGTPVVIFSDHGQLEVMSLGSTIKTQVTTADTSPDYDVPVEDVLTDTFARSEAAGADWGTSDDGHDWTSLGTITNKANVDSSEGVVVLGTDPTLPLTPDNGSVLQIPDALSLETFFSIQCSGLRWRQGNISGGSGGSSITPATGNSGLGNTQATWLLEIFLYGTFSSDSRFVELVIIRNDQAASFVDTWRIYDPGIGAVDSGTVALDVGLLDNWDAGDTYELKFEGSPADNYLRFKLWKTGDSEPSSWTGETTYFTPTDASGVWTIGFVLSAASWLYSGMEFDIDSLLVQR